VIPCITTLRLRRRTSFSRKELGRVGYKLTVIAVSTMVDQTSNFRRLTKIGARSAVIALSAVGAILLLPQVAQAAPAGSEQSSGAISTSQAAMASTDTVQDADFTLWWMPMHDADFTPCWMPMH
jgi:hypothetical protein